MFMKMYSISMYSTKLNTKMVVPDFREYFNARNKT